MNNVLRHFCDTVCWFLKMSVWIPFLLMQILDCSWNYVWNRHFSQLTMHRLKINGEPWLVEKNFSTNELHSFLIWNWRFSQLITHRLKIHGELWLVEKNFSANELHSFLMTSMSSRPPYKPPFEPKSFSFNQIGRAWCQSIGKCGRESEISC